MKKIKKLLVAYVLIMTFLWPIWGIPLGAIYLPQNYIPAFLIVATVYMLCFVAFELKNTAKSEKMRRDPTSPSGKETMLREAHDSIKRARYHLLQVIGSLNTEGDREMAGHMGRQLVQMQWDVAKIRLAEGLSKIEDIDAKQANMDG